MVRYRTSICMVLGHSGMITITMTKIRMTHVGECMQGKI